MGELEKDMGLLRNGLKEVEREIEFHRSQPVAMGDRFLPVMKEFLSSATCRFSELEDLFQDMKTRVGYFFIFCPCSLAHFQSFLFPYLLNRDIRNGRGGGGGCKS
jgi:hypothetical protein